MARDQLSAAGACGQHQDPDQQHVSSRAQGGIEVVTVRGDEEELEVPLVEDYVVELDCEGP